MRFSDRITFVQETESYYDPTKGEYVDGERIEVVRPCKLSTMGVDRTKELFGEIDRIITVARLQQPYNNPVDYVLIEGQKYIVKRQSNYRKGVFYVEGVR